MNLGEIRKLTEGKSDDYEVSVVIDKFLLESGAVFYSWHLEFKPPTVAEVSEGATEQPAEAENASEVTTEAVADAPVSE